MDLREIWIPINWIDAIVTDSVAWAYITTVSGPSHPSYAGNMAHDILFVALLRGLWPLTYFVFHPFATCFGGKFVDMMDTRVIRYHGHDLDYYAMWDSTFDKMSLCSTLVYLFLVYRHDWRWRVVMAFGVYRLIGSVLFSIVGSHWIPVIFPAVMGWLVLLMFTLDILGLPHVIVPRKRFIVVTIVIVITKTVYEYMHHLVFYGIAPVPPSTASLWVDEVTVLYVAMLGLITVIGLLNGPLRWRFWLWRALNARCLAPCKQGRKCFTPEEALWCAQKFCVDLNVVGFEWWSKGLQVELEHGWRTGQTNVTDDDLLKTGMIVLAHLAESPEYYQALEKMEHRFDEQYKDKPRPCVARWQRPVTGIVNV